MVRIKIKRTNPALREFSKLLGNWMVEISNADFLPNKSDKVKMATSFEWVENGSYISMYQKAGFSGPPLAIWLINRDESTKKYIVSYFDSRKVSRIYEMSFKKRVWKIWRNTPKFSQRFEGKISKDWKSIRAHWDKSYNGKKWERDFDVNYKRA